MLEHQGGLADASWTFYADHPWFPVDFPVEIPFEKRTGVGDKFIADSIYPISVTSFHHLALGFTFPNFGKN